MNAFNEIHREKSLKCNREKKGKIEFYDTGLQNNSYIIIIFVIVVRKKDTSDNKIMPTRIPS